MAKSRSLVLTAADRLAIEQGCVYDAKRGELPISFIESFCRQSQGRWGGQKLILLDWQKDFLRRLFGWRRADGTRRYRTAYLEVGKKNGKSTLLSALVLYLLLADGESAPKVFINACDREQASIIFDEAAQMVAASPELSKRLEVVDSRKRIVHAAGNGRIQANSAEAPNKDGANASAAIFDELHRQKDRELWDMFEYAGISRTQPLKITITTAGEDETGVWHEQREYSERVNRCEIPDTAHLGVVFRAGESDDLSSVDTWKKANPSLGHTMSEADFRQDYLKAKEIPTQLALFKRLRLNIITKTEARFLTPESWATCEPARPYGIKSFDGEPCWAGGDLSSTTDLTALVTLFGDEEQGYSILARFWLPEDRVDELARRDRVPYRLWIEQGYLTPTPGSVVDYEAFRSEIRLQAERFDLRKLLIDPHNATQLAVKLQDDDGLPVDFIRQGFLSLSDPTKQLERLVISRKLRHGDNPVLRWMAGNAIVVKDSAGNIKLDKQKSRQKIDGMAALVNAVAAMTSDPYAGESAESPLFFIGGRG